MNVQALPLCTIRFPLTITSNAMVDINHYHLFKDEEQLQINVSCQISSVNRIHTEEIDLLDSKQLNDLPTWYPVFETPYTIQDRVSLTPDTVTLQLTYIDKSKDLDILSCYE